MKISSYAQSYLARTFTGAALAASIVAAANPAGALTCSFAFPTVARVCQQASTVAKVSHTLGGNPIKFRFDVDFQGGSQVAVAYGIDVNGNNLNQCATTAADRNPSIGSHLAVQCTALYGTFGIANFDTAYNHTVNMASTTVIVL